MHSQRQPAGLLGYCLTDRDVSLVDASEPLYWWRTTGGFARVPLPFPALYPTRRHALDVARQLMSREFPVRAYPARLSLANAR